MKATFETVQGDSWKRIKARHLLVAAGGALLAVAAISGLGLRAEGPATANLPQAPASAQVLSKSQLVDLVVYVVGSQAEKEALERNGTLLEWFDEPGSGTPFVAMRTVVVDAGGEASLSNLLPEAGGTTGRGAKLTLYDMR